MFELIYCQMDAAFSRKGADKRVCGSSLGENRDRKKSVIEGLVSIKTVQVRGKETMTILTALMMK